MGILPPEMRGAGEPLLGGAKTDTEACLEEACLELPKTPGQKRFLSAVVVVFIVALGASLLRAMAAPTLNDIEKLWCEAQIGGDHITVLMVADPGDMSGTHEATYYLQQMKDVKDIPSGTTGVCMSKKKGILLGQHVMVVTTGIGPMSAASCMLELLHCAPIIKDVIFSGSSGVSPQVGGVLNPNDCSKANGGDTVRVGDVCVTPFSVNFDCHKSTWEQDAQNYPNICTLPAQVAGPEREDLFGSCMYTGSVELADEIMRAASKLHYLNPEQTDKPHAPAFPGPKTMFAQAVTDREKVYWGAMSNGTGLKYKVRDRPFVWNYTQCAEVNTQFFFSGSPYETRARNYTALTINSAIDQLGLDLPHTTMEDVVAVGDMESVGYMAVLHHYNLQPKVKSIPYTSVRAKSNHNISPIMKKGAAMWKAQPNPPPEDFVNGYGYAIQSYSAVVLGVMYERCVAGGHPPSVCFVTNVTRK